MVNVSWQYGVWENYKSIARTHGLTIPALKNLLRAANWLDGKRPTAKALEDGVAVVEKMTGGRFGDGERILWHVPKVKQYLAGHGVEPLNGEREGFYIAHRHQAVNRICEAAREIGLLLGVDPDEERTESLPEWFAAVYGKDAEAVYKSLHDDLMWFMFETHEFHAVIHNPSQFRALAEDSLEGLVEAARLKPDMDKGRLEHWCAVAENAVVWVESRRLKP